MATNGNWSRTDTVIVYPLHTPPQMPISLNLRMINSLEIALSRKYAALFIAAKASSFIISLSFLAGVCQNISFQLHFIWMEAMRFNYQKQTNENKHFLNRDNLVVCARWALRKCHSNACSLIMFIIFKHLTAPPPAIKHILAFAPSE